MKQTTPGDVDRLKVCKGARRGLRTQKARF